MAIIVGDKVHIITRRLFEADLRRHFAGVVEEVTDTMIRVSGHAFVFDASANDFVRRDNVRKRLFAGSDAGLVISILQAETELENLTYAFDDQGHRVLTDGKALKLNISEFGPNR